MDSSRYEKQLQQAADLLAFLCVPLFVIMAAVRLYPFQQELSEIMNGSADDWQLYASMGLEIKQNGWLIGSEQGLYNYPNGFLYNYFVAFCFLIFGNDPDPVYLCQAVLLGLFVWLTFKSFKDGMKGGTALLFACCLIIFSMLDVFKYYTFRLLSENLVLLTLALFFYLLRKWELKKSPYLMMASGLMLGFSVMTRPNLFPVGILICLSLLFFTLKNKVDWFHFLSFLILVFIGVSILALRNKTVCGQWVFFPVDSQAYFKKYLGSPDLQHVIKKLRFCFGDLSSVNETFRIRPHWMLLFVFYVLYLFQFIRKKISPSMTESLLQVYTLSYLLILIFVIDVNLIGSYGFRYVLPLVLPAIPLSVKAFDQAFRFFSRR